MRSMTNFVMQVHVKEVREIKPMLKGLNEDILDDDIERNPIAQNSDLEERQ